jgi:exosortase/archaeosortase family protein
LKSSKQPNFLTTSGPLLQRISVFLIIFVITSGFAGPRIINNGLLYKYYFTIYGPLGKALLFGTLAFSILIYRRLDEVKLERWRLHNIVWFVAGAVTYIYSWVGITHMLHNHSSSLATITTHLALLATIIFAALGCFSLNTVRQLIRTFRRQLLLALLLTVGFSILLYTVYGLWRVLSTIVLHGVRWLLARIGISSTVLPPETLLLNKFGISVSKYCSGIDSIALFSGLYIVVGMLDWMRLNHRRYLLAFIPGLLLLFGCNILRVFVLILGGYYINPKIAFSLFHTYAGLVFFILYSIIFWAVSYKWMLLKSQEQKA